jgi:hypothetical protein
LAAPLTPLCGNPVCRSTPVGNYWSRVTNIPFSSATVLTLVLPLPMQQLHQQVIKQDKLCALGSSINDVTQFWVFVVAPPPRFLLLRPKYCSHKILDPSPLRPWRNLWTHSSKIICKYKIEMFLFQKDFQSAVDLKCRGSKLSSLNY